MPSTKAQNSAVFLQRDKARHASLSTAFCYLKGGCWMLCGLCQGRMPYTVCISELNTFRMDSASGETRGQEGVEIREFMPPASPGWAMSWLCSSFCQATFRVCPSSLDSKSHFAFSVFMPWLFLGFCLVDFSKLCLHLCKDPLLLKLSQST